MKSCINLYGSPGIDSTLNAPCDYQQYFELLASQQYLCHAISRWCWIKSHFMTTNRNSDRNQNSVWASQLRFNWHQIIQKVQTNCFDLLGNQVIMKNNLYEQAGPGLLCFGLLEKIYGHNEEEFIWSGSKEKNNFEVS